MCLLASKWSLGNKSQLFFDIKLLANNFIFPGFYARLPFGEKILRTIMTLSFPTDKERKHGVRKQFVNILIKMSNFDVFWDKVVK